jgi:hypothetical protein
LIIFRSFEKQVQKHQGKIKGSPDITFDDHYLPNDKTFVGVEIKSAASPGFGI